MEIVGQAQHAPDTDAWVAAMAGRAVDAAESLDEALHRNRSQG
jgi:hypothetical protein